MTRRTNRWASPTSGWALALLGALGLSATGCASLRDNPRAGCASASDCMAGQACYRGFCIAADVDAGPVDAAVPPGVDAPFEDAGADAGSCPGAGVDCTYPMPGRCSVGRTVCRETGGTRCARVSSPEAESCNLADDDCDGSVDESAGLPCFTGDRGCLEGADGSFTCTGACTAGIQQCVGGMLQAACTGQVEAESTDGCTPPGALALDADCDGSVDEDCTCTDGATADCYPGRLEDAGHGACRLGTITCEGATFGDCVGAVVAAPESCGNPGVDDDCNDVVDDIPGTGVPCETGGMGVCADGMMACDGSSVACVGPAPATTETCDMTDDDCDGRVDESFDFASDAQHCGSCGNACGADQACCGGACVSTSADPANCGGCGVPCGGETSQCCAGRCAAPTAPECTGCPRDCAAEGLACCDFSCVDTDTDPAHCGAGPDGCGVVCGAGQRCCGGACVSDSEMNCGSCTACAAGARCCGAEGARSCAADRDPLNCNGCGVRCGGGTTCCDSGCSSLATDPANCGACGTACAGGQACSSGRCCNIGLTHCGGACVNTQTDGNNCGVCGRSCVLGCNGGECRVI